MNVTCPVCGKTLGMPDSAPRREGRCPRCRSVLPIDLVVSGDIQNVCPFKQGDVVVGCRIDRLVGCGGMAGVYEATQLSLGRKVAVKVLSAELAVKPASLARFAREARVLADLNHHNIVEVFDRGSTDDGHFYILMGFVDGASFRQVMHSKKISEQAKLELLLPVCDALTHAHEKGVVHRDLKPENILVDRRGNVKIVDFGIAALPEGEGRPNLTMTRAMLGTPDYMAPEQRQRAKTVDGRADIYSLGVILYELIAGHRPVGAFAPPGHENRDYPFELDSIVMRCLAPHPDNRHTSTRSVADAIRGAIELAHEPVFEMLPVEREPVETLDSGYSLPDQPASDPIGRPLGTAPRRRPAAAAWRSSPIAKIAAVILIIVGAALTWRLVSSKIDVGELKELTEETGSVTKAVEETAEQESRAGETTVPVTADASVVALGYRPSSSRLDIVNYYQRQISGHRLFRYRGRVFVYPFVVDRQKDELVPCSVSDFPGMPELPEWIGTDGSGIHWALSGGNLWSLGTSSWRISTPKDMKSLPVSQARISPDGCLWICGGKGESNLIARRTSGAWDVFPVSVKTQFVAFWTPFDHDHALAYLSRKGLFRVGSDGTVRIQEGRNGVPKLSLSPQMVSTGERDVLLLDHKLGIIHFRQGKWAVFGKPEDTALYAIAALSDGTTVFLGALNDDRQVLVFGKLSDGRFAELARFRRRPGARGWGMGYRTIVEDVDGSIVISAQEDMLRYRNQTLTRIKAPGPSPQLPFEIIADSKGRTWLVPPSQIRRNKVVMVNRGVWREQAASETHPIEKIVEDSRGTVWGTLRGLLVRRETDALWRAVEPPFSGRVSSSWGLAALPDGDIWIGAQGRSTASRRNERYLLCFRNGEWKALRPGDGLPAGKTLHRLRADGAGSLWAVTSEGIAYLDGNAFRLLEYGAAGSLDRVPGFFGTDSSGTLWAITRLPDDESSPDDMRSAIYRCDDRKWLRVSWPGQPADRLRCIERDPWGRFWIGMGEYTGGRFGGLRNAPNLACYDGNQWELYSKTDGVLPGPIRALRLDGQSQLWAGSLGWGVSVIRLRPPPVAKSVEKPQKSGAQAPVRVPKGFRAAPETAPEPYTNTGWAKDIIHEKTGIEMVFIPAGEFHMGSNGDRPDERPVHRARLTQPFYMGKFPVTVGEFARFADEHNYQTLAERSGGATVLIDGRWPPVKRPNASWRKPYMPQTPRHPVVSISWEDADAFCEAMGLSLPTEAQWEYACRAGSTGSYCFAGDARKLTEYAWYAANSGIKTHPVGKKLPNSWGLYDMHGQVWEWCADWYGERYYSSSPAEDAPGPASGSIHVFRGGCFPSGPEYATSSFRGLKTYPHCANYGFRAAFAITQRVLPGDRSQTP